MYVRVFPMRTRLLSTELHALLPSTVHKPMHGECCEKLTSFRAARRTVPISSFNGVNSGAAGAAEFHSLPLSRSCTFNRYSARILWVRWYGTGAVYGCDRSMVFCAGLWERAGVTLDTQSTTRFPCSRLTAGCSWRALGAPNAAPTT